MAIALGIDTGGTYTDAALVEYESGRVLARAKAPTTRHGLAIGIRQAMERVLAVGEAGAAERTADVCLVSLSTTLATNAIVEDQGAPVAVLLIGYGALLADVDLVHHLGTRRYALIAGGHHADGEEAAPLDLDAARAFITAHASHVAGFAVSGYFGTRNPAHELAVKALAEELTGLPVTCGHELTHRLDALRRATTVALNARLIPLLCDLIAAVEGAMAARGIHAPLMVVKGDGSLMRAEVARERPIETILSGPAASVVGAQHLAAGVGGGNGHRLGDAIVVDMGGTTTDIAVLSGGRPRLNPAGAQVGRWRTMVEAIDVHTIGLGGDSRVWFDEGRALRIGPRRVVPIALLAAEHPTVCDVLRQQTAALTDTHRGDDALGQFLLLQREEWRHDGEHPPFERALMERLARGPLALASLREVVPHPRLYARYFAALERSGVVARAGLTPTDAAHVLGLYRGGDAEAARLAAEVVARRDGRDAEALCRDIVARTSEAMAAEVVLKCVHDEEPQDGHAEPTVSPLDAHLIAQALRPAAGGAVGCTLTLAPSLVAIGAPVATYFPRVATLLHGRLCIPRYTEVANAVGAVVGSVVCRAHILIVPRQDEEGYRLHLPDGVADVATLADAVALAERRGRAAGAAAARRAGAQEITVTVERHDQSAPVAYGWGDEVHVQTTLTVTATGRPRLALRE
jgi:N-methylhydantoinase A/oxoprolinase/acetone carboxylase beta subunit